MNNNSPLGRGLESLIPKSQQKKDANQVAPQVSLPVDDVSGTTSAQPAMSAQEASKVFTRPPQENPGFGQARPTTDAYGQNHTIRDELARAEALAFSEAAEPISKAEERPIVRPEPVMLDSFFEHSDKPAVHIEPVNQKQKKQVPGETSAKKSDEAIYYIEVSKIHPNPDQPRRHFDETALRELASSIREFGIIQPIVVTKLEKDTENGTQVEYELVAGERRLMASKLLGLETIPAIVRNVRLERERLELAIIENLQRENLSPIEMARAYSRLQDEFRLTQREVASRLGKSRETVANTMRLLDLPTPIQEAIEKGQISESHGRLLLTIDDQALQGKLFRDLLANKMTIRELKDYSSHYAKTREENKNAKELSPEVKMAEAKLASNLGAPVSIKDHGGAGKITIAFYSNEELMNLLRRLGAQEDDS